MIEESFDFPPIDGKAVHQIIDDFLCVVVCAGCEVGVPSGGQDGAMAEDLLDFEKIYTSFDQMGCVTVT